MTYFTALIGKIRDFTSRMWSFIKLKPYVSTLIFLTVLFSVWTVLKPTNGGDDELITVKRGDVSQVVSVTGKVKAAEVVDLSFDRSGRIAGVYKDTGDRVYPGDLIVSLENGEISADLLQAEANVKVAEAKLEELKRGSRSEDIDVSRVALENASTDLLNNSKNAYVNADDAIRNKVDQMISNPKASSPQINFTTMDQQLKVDIESGRVQVETMLNSWSKVMAVSSSQDILALANESANNLRTMQVYLGKVALMTNSLVTSASLTQTTVDFYKSSIITARTNVTTALTNLTSAIEEYRNAYSALTLKEAGTASEQIKAQEATLEASKAGVLSFRAQLGKTLIRSPITGVVTRQNAKTGEIVISGGKIVSVISDSKYEIEANIPEADISKIKIGDRAKVTLDAYGNEVLFEATITEIDPAETVIEGVSTYTTTLQFVTDDPRIRSGMTANTDILGEKREGVFAIPVRAIVTEDGEKTVVRLNNGNEEDVVVTTGLRGSNGEIEILSGLSDGDIVKIK